MNESRRLGSCAWLNWDGLSTKGILHIKKISQVLLQVLYLYVGFILYFAFKKKKSLKVMGWEGEGWRITRSECVSCGHCLCNQNTSSLPNLSYMWWSPSVTSGRWWETFLTLRREEIVSRWKEGCRASLKGWRQMYVKNISERLLSSRVRALWRLNQRKVWTNLNFPGSWKKSCIENQETPRKRLLAQNVYWH